MLDDVSVRFLRCRLPLDMKDEDERMGEKDSGGDLDSDVVGNSAGAGVEGVLEMGAISFVMRASIKVRKVNETL